MYLIRYNKTLLSILGIIFFLFLTPLTTLQAQDSSLIILEANKDSFIITQKLHKNELLYTSFISNSGDFYTNSSQFNFAFNTPYFLKRRLSIALPNFHLGTYGGNLSIGGGLGLRVRLKDWVWVKPHSFHFLRLFVDNHWSVIGFLNNNSNSPYLHQLGHQVGCEFGSPIDKFSLFIKAGILTRNEQERAPLKDIYRSSTFSFSTGIIIYNSLLLDAYDFLCSVMLLGG